MLFSVLVSLIVLVYGLSKFMRFMSNNNPNVSSFLEHDVLYSKESVLNLREQNF